MSQNRKYIRGEERRQFDTIAPQLFNLALEGVYLDKSIGHTEELP